MKKVESTEQYNTLIQSGKHIMMFSADWCSDCRFIEPVLPEIIDEYKEYEFYYVDRDKFIDLCAQLNIFGIPSFVAYKEGEEIGRYVNKDRKTKEQIQAFINSLPA